MKRWGGKGPNRPTAYKPSLLGLVTLCGLIGTGTEKAKMNEQATQQEKDQEPQQATDGPETSGSSRRRRSRQRHLETSVNMDELRELITLIQENGFAEFELEREGFRIHVRRDLAVSEVGEAARHAAIGPPIC